MAFRLGNTDLRSLGDGCWAPVAAPASSPFLPKPLCGSFSDLPPPLPPIPVFKGWPEGGLIFSHPQVPDVKASRRCTSAEGAELDPSV